MKNEKSNVDAKKALHNNSKKVPSTDGSDFVAMIKFTV